MLLVINTNVRYIWSNHCFSSASPDALVPGSPVTSSSNTISQNNASHRHKLMSMHLVSSKHNSCHKLIEKINPSIYQSSINTSQLQMVVKYNPYGEELTITFPSLSLKTSNHTSSQWFSTKAPLYVNL